MAITKIADVIVPELFNPYVINRTMELSALVQSGIIVNSPEFDRLASEAARTHNMPFFEDLTGDSENVVEDVKVTPAKIGSNKDVSTTIFRQKAWASTNLAAALAGADPMKAIGDLVAGFWSRDMQKELIALLAGIFGTYTPEGGKAATPMADHILDLTAQSSAAAKIISASAFIDACQLMGDAQGLLTDVAMHSATKAYLKKKNLIETERDSTDVEFDTYQGRRVTAGTTMSGGTNGEADGESYQEYLTRAESYTFHTMGLAVTDDTTKKLFAAFNRRMRDEMGIKFQLVVYNLASADYMGVISVKNKCTDGMEKTAEGVTYPNEAALVYWVTGAQAGCAVNKSCQKDLVNAMKSGEFVLHQVNSEIRVLADINTMVTVTDTCGDVFKENQTVRVIDQLANDDAVLFNTRYLGVVPNDASGRTALWSDLVKIRQELQKIRAIEGFSDSDVTVAQGENRKSVVVESSITVVNAMSQLYMTVTVA